MAATLQQIHKKYYSQLSEETFMKIVSSDPTYDATNRPDKRGQYAIWLLNMVIKGIVEIEDLEECSELLDIFNRYKTLMAEKDIMKYKSVEQLAEAVSPYQGNDSTISSKAAKIRKIKEGAEHVYMDDDWLIVIPHTWEAAKYYSKGTRWCTAYRDSDNYFNQYNDEGPLYININRHTHDKWQFHFQSDTYCDAEDDPIDINEFLEEMTDGVRKFYRQRVDIADTSIYRPTFSEMWANFLAAGGDCSTIDFTNCAESDDDVTFRPENLPNEITSLQGLFRGCHGLRRIDLSGLNLTNVVDFSYMFESCDHLESVNLSGWNVTNDISIDNMFANCLSLHELTLQGCNMNSVKQILFAIEKDGRSNLPDIRITADSEVQEARRQLMDKYEAFDRITHYHFYFFRTVKQDYDIVKELLDTYNSLIGNPLYCGTRDQELRTYLLEDLAWLKKTVQKEIDVTFITKRVGPLLFSRPDVNKFIRQNKEQSDEVWKAHEIVTLIRHNCPENIIDEDTLSEAGASFMVISMKYFNMPFRHVADSFLKKKGFSDRWHVAIPFLTGITDKITDTTTSGLHNLRMSRGQIVGLLIFFIIMIAVMVLMALSPWTSLFMFAMYFFVSLADDRIKKWREWFKMTWRVAFFIAAMQVISWIKVSPIVSKIRDGMQPEETTVNRIVDVDKDRANVEPLVVCGDTLSVNDVHEALRDTVPFSNHILPQGISVAQWYVNVMKKEYKEQHPDVDSGKLNAVGAVLEDRLKDCSEKETRNFVSSNDIGDFLGLVKKVKINTQ